MPPAPEQAAVDPCEAGSIVQPALVELAGLHDDGEVLALILEQRQILQRIAVDHQEIGEGAGRERADLALQAQDLRRRSSLPSG